MSGGLEVLSEEVSKTSDPSETRHGWELTEKDPGNVDLLQRLVAGDQ